jgi:hypothetical protein
MGPFYCEERGRVMCLGCEQSLDLLVSDKYVIAIGAMKVVLLVIDGHEKIHLTTGGSAVWSELPEKFDYNNPRV